MKLQHLLFVSCFALLSLNVFAGLTFTETNQFPAGKTTITTGTNGIILNLKPGTGNKFAYIYSDQIPISNTPTEFYVTLLCTNTAADFGINVGDTANLQAGLNSLVWGSNTEPKTDTTNMYYPYSIIKGNSANAYIPDIGETIRYTLTSYSGSSYFELKIRGKE